jgi:hypothetical protein
MNPADLIKLGVLAGGGFFLWQWYQKQQTETPPPATGGTTTPPTGGGTTPPPTPPAPPQQANANPTEQNIKRAAAYAPWALEAGNRTYNWHEWNFWRNQFNPSLAVPAPESVGQGDGLAKITASQYHAALATAGLAGLALRRAARLR